MKLVVQESFLVAFEEFPMDSSDLLIEILIGCSLPTHKYCELIG